MDDTQHTADANGQVTAVGTGDKATYEREAIAGSVGSSGNHRLILMMMAMMACLLLMTTDFY